MGQDEFGGHNAKNYLCALFGAEHCLKTALTLAAEIGVSGAETETWRDMLQAGLAYDRLYDAVNGMYLPCEVEAQTQKTEQQKHPVQLNPLTFLPLERIDAAVKAAYESRYALCGLDSKKSVPGWTLGAYWLAAAHMRDAAGMLSDLDQMARRDYMDDAMIQFYESSSAYRQQYYTTTHGLFLQAVNDAFVSDFWPVTEMAAAKPGSWAAVSFHRLRTKRGEELSGTIS